MGGQLRLSSFLSPPPLNLMRRNILKNKWFEVPILKGLFLRNGTNSLSLNKFPISPLPKSEKNAGAPHAA